MLGDSLQKNAKGKEVAPGRLADQKLESRRSAWLQSEVSRQQEIKWKTTFERVACFRKIATERFVMR